MLSRNSNNLSGVENLMGKKKEVLDALDPVWERIQIEAKAALKKSHCLEARFTPAFFTTVQLNRLGLSNSR